jgi:hypothetical protein
VGESTGTGISAAGRLHDDEVARDWPHHVALPAEKVLGPKNSELVRSVAASLSAALRNSAELATGFGGGAWPRKAAHSAMATSVRIGPRSTARLAALQGLDAFQSGK